MRTFFLAGVASSLSLALYALFVATTGVGGESDAFFAALAPAQTLAGLLFASYEVFAQRYALDRLRAGTAPVAPLVASYLALSAAVLVPYYLWGEALLGPLFGRAYAADPALWRHHYAVLGALVPLTGAVAVLQVCCQARARYELPKVALVVGRLAALGLFVAAGDARAMSAVLVAAQVIALVVSAPGAGAWRAPAGALPRETRAVLGEWLRVSRWTAVLKTDQLLERVLAARVATGFLSLFSIGWSAMLSLVDAYHAAFVVPDANHYHAAGGGGGGRAGAGGFRALLAGPFRASRVAGSWLAALAATVAAAAAIAALATGWAPAGVRPGEVALLLATLLAALLVSFAWKQLGAAYAIQHRAVELARALTLVYLVFALPRIGLTWQLGAVGFCVGLVAYYGTQVGVLGRRV